MALDKQAFFGAMNAQGLALTFDDVRLATRRSDYTASAVSIASRFSRNVELRSPIASAAMDTVTTAKMAIAMAKMGGIGVIHAGLTPTEQRDEVRKVKHALNGRIDKPICVRLDQTLAEVAAMCQTRDFAFRTFPVIDDAGHFAGLLTQNDFDFGMARPATKISAVMTPAADVVTGRETLDVARAFTLMKKHKKKTIPLVDGEANVKGLYVLSDVVRLVGGNPDNYNLDARGRLRVAAAVPTDDGALERIELMGDYLDVAVIDSAQGDSKFAFSTLKAIKRAHPKLDVVVGNVSSAESARLLAEAGADGIKVGQGPGSICTTRIETGIGCPQVTAIYECVEAAREYDVPVCADGGITSPGDISIAIAAGASCVMMGSKLAGTSESPGEVTVGDNGQMVKLYRGMGSPTAMRDSAASRARYGVDGTAGKPLSEGVESYVAYKGSVIEVLDHYIKALRKSMSYVGSADIAAHQSDTRFIRITNAGYRESQPHDVAVIVSS